MEENEVMDCQHQGDHVRQASKTGRLQATLMSSVHSPRGSHPEKAPGAPTASTPTSPALECAAGSIDEV